MTCSACGADSTITAAVPDELREYAPANAAAVTICQRCLTVESASDGTGASVSVDPDFTRISDAFPTRPAQAIPLALTLSLCSSLATNRAAIESLLEAVERAGADPLLVIDRLCADPDVEPTIDLERRRHQLEQLLY